MTEVDRVAPEEREGPANPAVFDSPEVRAKIARALEATGGDPTPWERVAPEELVGAWPASLREQARWLREHEYRNSVSADWFDAAAQYIERLEGAMVEAAERAEGCGYKRIAAILRTALPYEVNTSTVSREPEMR